MLRSCSDTAMLARMLLAPLSDRGEGVRRCVACYLSVRAAGPSAGSPATPPDGGRRQPVKRCPRCHSSMLPDQGDIQEGYHMVWHCLGCGREILQDTKHQVEDERLLHAIMMIGG